MSRTRALAVFAVVVALFPAQSFAREGFGFSKRAAKLNRQVPPEIYLAAQKVDVKLDKKGDREQAAEKLRDLVETKLTTFETNKLTADSAKPDVVVKVSLDGSNYNEAFEQKTSTEYKQVGTKQEWNAKKAKYETVPVYDNVPVYKSFKRVSGNLLARYEVLDAKTKKAIHSSTVETSFNDSFENGVGAPSRHDVEGQLIEKAASKVAAQLVGSVELVAVLLPRGSFDSFVSLAEGGVWDRYYASVTNVPAKNRPGDEAYRQYAFGVANEAMAYRAADMDEAMKYLRTAENHYLKATELKPDEKLFTQAYSNVWTGGEGTAPIQRVKSGIANYERLREYKLTGGKSATTTRTAAAASTGSPVKPASSRSRTLGNESLIEMSKAGLSDENIMLAIDGASTTNFDLTPDGLIALSRAGVSKNVIAHVQKRERKKN